MKGEPYPCSRSTRRLVNERRSRRGPADAAQADPSTWRWAKAMLRKARSGARRTGLEEFAEAHDASKRE